MLSKEHSSTFQVCFWSQSTPISIVFIYWRLVPNNQKYKNIINKANYRSLKLFLSFLANLGAFGLGTGLGWSSPALPFLSNCNNENATIINNELNNCTLPEAFSDETASWIGAFFAVGAMFGGFITGILLPLIGRKWTMIGLSIPFTIGKDFYNITIGDFFLPFFVGFIYF